MLDAIGDRDADVMVEAKGKEHALPPEAMRQLVVRQAIAD